jgi:membrane protein implicated in regulation of membrane protease activity
MEGGAAMESVFLGCFLFGLLLVITSVVLGFAHVALPGADSGYHAGHADASANGHGAASEHGALRLPVWNVSSILAFLMWFGAAGYLGMRVGGLSALPALLPAVVSGLLGGLLLSAFLRFVTRGETEMRADQYRMEGTLARVTVGIPAGGTGEILFSKGGSRRGEGARSIDGGAIGRGEEVVVLDYHRGIALVQRWEEFREG